MINNGGICTSDTYLKRKLTDDVGTGSSFAFRHRMWLQRQTKADGWRPRPTFRNGSKKICEIADNHIRVSTPFGGLIRFKEDPASMLWQVPERWPGCGMTFDQDIKNISAMNALQHKYGLHVWPWWDEQLTIKSTWETGLRDVKLFDFQLLLLICDNYKQSHNKDDERKWLHQERMEAVHEKNPEDVPGFMAACPFIVDELRTTSHERRIWSMRCGTC